MSVTCYLSGRLGNCVYAIAHMIAYAKKYDLQYYIPQNADSYMGHSRHRKNPFGYIPSTGTEPVNPIRVQELNMAHGTPFYDGMPMVGSDVLFDGYYQSAKYFDWCREDILKIFRLPDFPESGTTGIHVRRGDCVNSPNFPMAPLEYYQNAVKHMQEKGFNFFRIYSDDMKWCMEHFTEANFPDAELHFHGGQTEMEDYVSLLNCANQITARSTFSLTAAWFNWNPNKIVLVPTLRHPYFVGQNKDLIPEYFVQIDFENPF